MSDVSEGLDPEKNPSEWGAESEPPLAMAEVMIDRSEAIAKNFSTTWKPSGLPTSLSKAAPTGERKYSEDEPRDEHGMWTAGGGAPIGAAEGGTRIRSIDDAVRLLGQGKGVMFEKPEHAVTLLHELARIANEAKAAGQKAPNYDLCKVSVTGTNLFCSENVGIPRSAMPQLVGKPIPGSPADSLPKNEKGEVDLGQAFRDSLAASGHVVTDENEPADRLRASQTEMNGVKVAGMMEAMEAGKIAPAPIFISNDNYVIDGHHRWAATVGMEYDKGEKLLMPVTRIDMQILPALAAANQFATSMGIPQSDVTKAFFAALDMKFWPGLAGGGEGFEAKAFAEYKSGNPDALRKYFNDGAGGRIDWGSPGDFDDCVEIASEHMTEDQAKGFCNERHQDATGAAPGHAAGENEK
jgi:hypothetical protein